MPRSCGPSIWGPRSENLILVSQTPPEQVGSFDRKGLCKAWQRPHARETNVHHPPDLPLRQSHKTILIWAILILMFVSIYSIFTDSSSKEKEIDATTFV